MNYETAMSYETEGMRIDIKRSDLLNKMKNFLDCTDDATLIEIFEKAIYRDSGLSSDKKGNFSIDAEAAEKIFNTLFDPKKMY